MDRAPSIFISHGAPTEAIEWGRYQENLKQYAMEIGKPRAIVSISAHWQNSLPVLITSNEVQRTIHDFYGFPEQLYSLKYDAPGEPKLAKKIALLLSDIGIKSKLTSEWGLDHGTWVPLKIMYPSADVPVLQVSIPIPRSPKELKLIGETLQSLRDEGVMLMGSGGVTHNLRLAMQNLISERSELKPDSWAYEFDKWIKDQLEEGKFHQIFEVDKHPLFPIAAPTTEHFDPIHFMLGTLKPNEGIRQIHEQIKYGNLSLRSFASEA